MVEMQKLTVDDLETVQGGLRPLRVSGGFAFDVTFVDKDYREHI